MDHPDPASSVAAAHLQNLRLQAEQYPLINDRSFFSIETYVNHLIHLKAYEEAAQLLAGKAVLDIGCNMGYGIQILLSKVSSAAGLDLSPQAIKAAQERLGSRADIRLYDGVQCGFASYTFDAVTSFQVIEHVSDYGAYLSEIIRLIHPGGTVLFTTPNAAIRLDPGMKPWYEFHVREFTASELRELLLKWFGVVEIRGLFGQEEIYKTERDRCERTRIIARSRLAKWRPVVKRTVKRLLPWVVNARNALRPKPPEPENLSAAELQRFSTRDLFYRADRLEDALDLMAICRNPRPR